MNEDVKQYLSKIGRIGGTSGTGDSKKRTRDQYVSGAETYWLGVFSNRVGVRNHHGSAERCIHDAIPGRKNTGRSVLVCGCTRAEFIIHIERQFYSHPQLGEMTWNNKHQWEIDHIVPRSSFDTNDPMQMLECWHWTNLRPMWKTENQKKASAIMHQWACPFSERKKWTVGQTRINENGLTEPIAP